MDLAEVLKNIGFEWRMALANLVNFLIILFILKKFAFEPIKKKLEEREQKIEKGVEDAQRAATELQMAQTSRDKTLMNARLEGDKLITLASDKANKIIEQAKQAADEKQQEMIVKAKKILDEEKQKMLQSVKADVVETVIDATEKMIEQKLDESQDKKIVKDIID